MKQILGLVLIFMLGCKGAEENTVDGTEVSENAQQIGDVMASIDEFGGKNSSTIVLFNKSLNQSFARVFPQDSQFNSISQILLPQAWAASCTDYSSFTWTCDGTNKITHAYNGCTVFGSVIFSGSVTYEWINSGANCLMNGNTSRIRRTPNITVTGRRGATLTITKTGSIGQELARGASADDLSFTSDGINRKFTTSANQVLFNHTTKTSTAIALNKAARLGRVITSGGLEVKNNISNVTCTYSPTNVTWGSGSCNCPTSGSWSGNCNDGNGHNSTTSLVITGCGTGTYSEGTETSSVTFDRCGT